MNDFSTFVAVTKQKTHPILLEYLKSLIAKEPGVTVEAYFESLKKTKGFAVRQIIPSPASNACL
jgi:hypothetical protein